MNPLMAKLINFTLLFYCLLAGLSAWGGREEKPLMEVTGVVRLVGNEPFTEMVISGPEGEWFIEKDDEYKLKDLQYQIITVEAEETVINLTFANGMPAGERRSLKNLRIITVQ